VIRHEYEDAVLVGWSVGLKVDLKPTFHSASAEEKFNHVEYRNPEVDDLIERALAAETFEEAGPHWREAQERIVADSPYTFLFILDRIFGVNERVRGTVPDARGYYRSLSEWWIPESRQRARGA
jgi:peptide/nickel transport system substrate-binding protein